MTSPALTPFDHPGRIEALRTAMARSGLDALAVTHLTNVRYLSGFTGSAGLVVILPDRTLFVSDGRYGEQADKQVGGHGIDIEISSDGQAEIVSGAVARASVERIGFEGRTIGWREHRNLGESWFAGVEMVETDGLVEGLRSVKDQAEIERIEAAAWIADAALAELRPTLWAGPTEREFALALDVAMRAGGASGPSFETIVASGPNSAVPHHRPTDRRIAEGDLVVLDFGARVDGYCSDMTRTLCVGEPDPTQRRLLDVVGAAQAAGVATVVAGAAARDVDAACRTIIDDAGWGERFTHGTGHGVGLDIHEDPRVGRTSGDTLAAGQVVTVEPGVYLPGVGGVRVEDSVVVTHDGCAPVTLTPKDFSIGTTWQPSPPPTSRTA